MVKKLVFMAVIVSFVFAASMASANLVTLKYLGVTNPINVRIGLPGGGSVYTYAGSSIIQYPYITGTMNYGAYCVEPQSINPGRQATFDLQPIPELSGYEAAAWVLSQGYTGAMAAAAQVAVWELTWDYQVGNAFSLTADNFRLFSPSALVTNATTIYNAALDGMGADFDQSRYLLAVNACYQNFVVPDPVPIPGAVWLLGSGLLGLVAIRRRMKN